MAEKWPPPRVRERENRYWHWHIKVIDPERRPGVDAGLAEYSRLREAMRGRSAGLQNSGKLPAPRWTAEEYRNAAP